MTKRYPPQGMKAVLFTVPSERVTANAGEDNVGYMNTLQGQDEEHAALLEVQAIIDEHSDEVDGHFEMENEQLSDEDSDDGGEIDDNTESGYD